MPTNKPRVTITMNSGQLDKIEEYRFKNRFKNQTQAILSLIDAGFAKLNSNEDEGQEPCISDEILDVINKYCELDAHGKDMVDTVLDKEYKRVSQKNVHAVLLKDQNNTDRKTRIIELPQVARGGNGKPIRIETDMTDEELLEELKRTEVHRDDTLV